MRNGLHKHGDEQCHDNKCVFSVKIGVCMRPNVLQLWLAAGLFLPLRSDNKRPMLVRPLLQSAACVSSNTRRSKALQCLTVCSALMHAMYHTRSRARKGHTALTFERFKLPQIYPRRAACAQSGKHRAAVCPRDAGTECQLG